MSMYLAYKMNMLFYTFFSAKFLVFAPLVSGFLTTQTQIKIQKSLLVGF